MLSLRTRDVKLEAGSQSTSANVRWCSASVFAIQAETFSSFLPKYIPNALLHFCFPFWAQFFKIKKNLSWVPREVKGALEGSANTGWVERMLDTQNACTHLLRRVPASGCLAICCTYLSYAEAMGPSGQWMQRRKTHSVMEPLESKPPDSKFVSKCWYF